MPVTLRDYQRAFRQYLARRRLAKLVARNRAAPATQSYAAHRQAAVKGRGR
jgi:hypothetical protein